MPGELPLARRRSLFALSGVLVQRSSFPMHKIIPSARCGIPNPPALTFNDETIVKHAKLVLAATLLGTCAMACADGGGTFTVQGKTIALKDAYAYSRPDPFDHSKQTTLIAFSTRLIDKKQIDAAQDHAGALSDAMNLYFPDKEERPSSVEIMIARNDPESPIQQISYSTPDRSSSASTGSGNYKLELKSNDGKRIEGTLHSTKEAAKTAEHGGYFDLHFALDVANDSGTGK